MYPAKPLGWEAYRIAREIDRRSREIASGQLGDGHGHSQSRVLPGNGIGYRFAAVIGAGPCSSSAPMARHVEHVPDEATEGMHDGVVIRPPVGSKPIQPDQQPDCRFPQDPIHLIKQLAEIVGEAILPPSRRHLRRG